MQIESRGQTWTQMEVYKKRLILTLKIGTNPLKFLHQIISTFYISMDK